MANALKHKFASAKADGADTTLVRPSNWNEEHVFAGGAAGKFLRWEAAATDKVAWDNIQDAYVTQTNNSGGALAANDVVIEDDTLDTAVTTTTSAQSPKEVFIAAEAIGSGADGLFRRVLLATVAVTGAVARGDFLGTSTSAKLAASLGATAVDGAFGRAMTSAAGPGAGTVVAILFGSTLQVKAIGTYASRGIQGNYNSGSIFDVTAHAYQMRDSSDRLYVKQNPGSLSVNITTTGPGGRDQAGAFGASTFVYVYAIGKADGTTALCVSATAPPTGPDLITLAGFAGYIAWGFLGVLLLDGAVAIRRCQWTGNKFFYEATPAQVLTAGNATAETAVSISSWVPAIAQEVMLEVSALMSTVSQANALRIRVTTAVELLNYKTQTTAPGTLLDHPVIPQRSQQFYYLRQTALATDIWVLGFTVPSAS